ncbi:MAG: anaerobic ribonucleoside-triphosphate reductase activating protein [Candidatus Bathyarchaeia archaeon]|jgi:pyruvate formate lyase activating enzyme
MDVKGFVDLSFVDWDGKVSSVVFLPCCNFRCPFCHNVNLVLNPETIETIPLEDILDQLERQKDWIDGVCITGGEPTLHNSLPELFLKIKKLGFQVKLDTNGTNPEMLKSLIDQGLVDYVAMDIKAPLALDKYSKATGVNAENLLHRVKKSIKLLMDSNIDYEFRTTVVPTIHNQEDIQQICQSIRGCKKYVLQKFDVTIGKEVIDKDLLSKSINEEKMDKFLAVAQKYIPNAKRR